MSRFAKVTSWGASVLLGLSIALSAAAAQASTPDVVPQVTDASAAGPTVVAIGDSIMEGHGLAPDQAWPALLAQRYGWRLTNLASDGSGFATAGNNGDTFADQVAVALTLHPSIVIISGSSNDVDRTPSTLSADTEQTLQTLRAGLPDAQILVVSPVWSDTPEPDRLASIDVQTAGDAQGIGARVIDIGQPLSGRADLMLPDDVHPTAQGQQAIAQAVARALATRTAQSG
ncbi:MAG: SGNH/GDSL hydrolase family protein [Microbacterium sp.]|jgi:acyl-CoA thioesterase-1|uniref:SGNH/GDSL hydrolase family protein n=1 Tax=Microbacterium sp. TaxID=51671 RepID=UPI00282318B0|nr:SGNH/GDSL hydrolase family protein [Microbacterium sp.]MDR2323198.1 SGNH/GDSL hydrolase family protein [Microbacterium sp.]